jgi:hypothetical protein
MELAVGEKYLNVVLSVEKILYLANKAIVEGKDNVNIGAFKNKEARSENSPHYNGNGLAIWISTKKAPKQEEKVYQSVEEVL